MERKVGLSPNVIEDEVIYTFKPMPSNVGIIVQSPVVDVVAIGCQDGSICLVNLKFDELLFTFKQKEGKVTMISFLTDSTLNLSLMATASS